MHQDCLSPDAGISKQIRSAPNDYVVQIAEPRNYMRRTLVQDEPGRVDRTHALRSHAHPRCIPGASLKAEPLKADLILALI